MMFKKYNSIENAYRKEFIERVAIATANSNDFVVQEKVHGANFSLITNGKDLRSAKRTSILEDTDTFYNHASIKSLYYEKMLALFEAVKIKYPNTESITVFGELFGGSYPDVEQVRGAFKVQKGVFYAPYNEFYAFDIMINQEFYLNVIEVNQLLETHGFFYAKTLCRGTLKEVLDYPNAFDSKIPEWLKLPEISDNICEGVVIKPIEPHFLPNGSRVIIKNKNAKWSEKSKANSKHSVQIELSKEAHILLSELERYVNPNRLANVMSKESNLDSIQIGKLIGLLSKDAFEDFLKAFKIQYKTLEKSEQKRLTKQLNQYSAKLVRQELLQLY
ncbi:RNA ligase family protein [uncultured Psychroserpens sp.]|uniref:RNA ligase family protein n=1 Tax=uncultured Psychroserpens sp. TaxID=255436 RepID=UPI002614BC17|nr:RNA ligase family protein [uncultured Psychroserpens sp.]